MLMQEESAVLKEPNILRHKAPSVLYSAFIFQKSHNTKKYFWNTYVHLR